MGLQDVLSHLRMTPEVARCIAAWREMPPRPAQYADFPGELSPSLLAGLRSRGIDRLYTHQARAIREVLDGRNVIVVTPTASGKTLCYNVPVLDAILRDSSARALYLFPTKALAQDQMHELQRLVDAAEASVRVATYDGDTSVSARQDIRRANQVVISNPDMLHMGILPHHTRWAGFLRSLRFVVIDEVHAYRGIFGSHLANVIRRLKRICRFYGASPQFICCSATVANAGDLAIKLLEEPVHLIDQNGAPSGAKHIIFYNPPMVNQELGIRRSAALEARRLALEFLLGGVQSIVFTRTRVTTEVLLRYLQEDVRRHRLGEEIVQGYRGGYLPSERRDIERGLRQADIRCVVATNALELGIDIGQLDACVMTGYPGTIASTWQQAGRAGRRTDVSAAIMVASASPLDQFLIKHPDYFFGRSPERVLINPNNLVILVNHMRCAAFELPFQEGEAYGDLTPAHTSEILEYLGDAGELHRVGGTWHWMSESYPAQSVPLRTADPDNFVIMNADVGNSVIGEVDRFSAPTLLHEGAIYLHRGDAYHVEDLDWDQRRALVRPAQVGYYTEANQSVKVSVMDVLDEQPCHGGGRASGEVVVTSVATTYRKVRYYTREIIGHGDIHLPEQQMHTTAYWFYLDEEMPRDAGSPDRGPNWRSQRRRARDRDRYICQVCGAAEDALGREHDVHHIRPFREFGHVPGINNSYLEANALDNLISLCRTCHRRVVGDRLSRDVFANGLRGLGYVLHHLAPLYLMCEPQNLGVFSELRSPLSGKPTIYLYDRVPAGVGFSEALFQLHDDLLAQASEIVSICPCADGCPSCVGPAAAEGEEGKQATLSLLDRLLGEVDPSKGE